MREDSILERSARRKKAGGRKRGPYRKGWSPRQAQRVATASISTLAPRGRAAAWTVDRAG